MKIPLEKTAWLPFRTAPDSRAMRVCRENWRLPCVLTGGKQLVITQRLAILSVILSIGFGGLLTAGMTEIAAIHEKNEKPMLWEDALSPEEIAAIRKKENPITIVTVDQNLVDEQIGKEKILAQGRATRQSRDLKLADRAEKTGPSSETDTAETAFKLGEISPADRGERGNPNPPSPDNSHLPPSPEAAASPALAAIPESPPIPPIPHLQNDSPAAPVAKTPPENSAPIEKIEKIEKIEPPKLPPAAENKTDAESLALPPSIENFDLPKLTEIDPQSFMPLSNSSAKMPTESPEKSIGALPASEKLSAKSLAEKRLPTTAQTPAESREPVPETPERSARPPVPTRIIGGNQGGVPASGGKLRRQSGGALAIGIQSIAVLRSRYGEYFDELLRRIQAAILIQQQLLPPMFTSGVVTMTFTVGADGRLEKIALIESAPHDLTQEIAAARRVLDDVKNGKPLSPPTREMLADPLFQKITINFLFEPR